MGSAMESLLTEMYSLRSQNVPPAQLISERREMRPGLRWERKSSCEALIQDGTFQKKTQRTQHLLAAGACEDPLAQGAEECADQSSLEAKMVLQQEGEGKERHLQADDLLGRKEQLDAGSWNLEFESESDHEEIYWGCFYFFPWLRMCRRDKREQP
ncbi:uncharacterized protein LOC128345465 isoform X2 [Hemicordylus capensis]|uniref:uncharacterized protein LOC128345465 isoform X2 n=1 Tax=Hemicordylus capensis TaxID=884348 RepID=UPI0023034FAA|nr:uncharacterized protein LOC128345465 isoform X2 [Hemicordylus capensis]